MNKETVRHELLHILGSTYGLYAYALKYNVSFKKLFDQALVHLDLRGSVAAGTAGECAMHIPDMPAEHQLTINVHGSLVPAGTDGDAEIKQAIRSRSVDPLYHSHSLSDGDRGLFSKAPLPLGTVIEASIVAKEYINLLGARFHKFAPALDAAVMTHEDLPLSAIVNFDRFMVAVRHLPEQRNEFYRLARHVE
jgi:hypothetical protein